MCDTRTAFEWKIGWDALSESKLNLRLRGWSIYFLLGSLVFNPIYGTMCLRSQEFAEKDDSSEIHGEYGTSQVVS